MVSLSIPVGGDETHRGLEFERFRAIVALEESGLLTVEEILDEGSLLLEAQVLEDWLTILQGEGFVEEIPRTNEPSQWKIKAGAKLNVYFRRP